jgi:UDP-N-acetylglucosamine 2-epimerase (hydrolysing)
MRLGFLTSTRADWSKLEPLVRAASGEWPITAIVTGMHLDPAHGETVREVERVVAGLPGCALHVSEPDRAPRGTERHLAGVVADACDAVAWAIETHDIGTLVVHGDRAEALGGAAAGVMLGVRVAHVEGGESSGGLDDRTRHAITQLADIHFTTSDAATQRVRQAAGPGATVIPIGSPELDVLLGDGLPTLHQVGQRYGMTLVERQYGIAIVHPVTGPDSDDAWVAITVRDALLRTPEPYACRTRWVILHANSEPGRADVMRALDEVADARDDVRSLPSMRFAHFARLLRDAAIIVGNSSCGVREAPAVGVPSIDLGTRQTGRHRSASIQHDPDDLAAAINAAWGERYPRDAAFGDGHAGERFVRALESLR